MDLTNTAWNNFPYSCRPIKDGSTNSASALSGIGETPATLDVKHGEDGEQDTTELVAARTPPCSSAGSSPWHRPWSPDHSSRDSSSGAEPLSPESISDIDAPESVQSPPNIHRNDSAEAEVFRNEFFVVAPSPIAGMGAFATRDLKAGDTILQEGPLFTGESSAVLQEFAGLDEDSQKRALDLHASGKAKPGMPRILTIWQTNCFSTGRGNRAGLFPIASRFNHACQPRDNIQYTFDVENECLIFVVKADTIAAGDELTISYGYERTPLDLFLRFGFRCRCGACEGLDTLPELW